MKFFKSLFICLSLALGITTINYHYNPVVEVQAATIKLSKSSQTLYLQRTITLEVKGTKQRVTWKSKNKKIATVTNQGVVRGIKAGKTTITAKVAGKTLKCKITVKNPTLTKTSYTLYVGESYRLKVKNGTGSVSWSSLNKSIAKVSGTGTVKGLKAGSTTISAKVAGVTLKCKITVKKASGNEYALHKAKKYLSETTYSKEGLKAQLISDKFTKSQAEYAVNHCKADWKAQALKKAKNYVKAQAFSKKGLKDQLVYEKFTASQAEYAANKCGANWNTQAVRKAKEYMKIFEFTKAGLKQQLIDEGFTTAQADYGVKNCGAKFK